MRNPDDCLKMQSTKQGWAFQAKIKLNGRWSAIQFINSHISNSTFPRFPEVEAESQDLTSLNPASFVAGTGCDTSLEQLRMVAILKWQTSGRLPACVARDNLHPAHWVDMDARACGRLSPVYQRPRGRQGNSHDCDFD